MMKASIILITILCIYSCDCLQFPLNIISEKLLGKISTLWSSGEVDFVGVSCKFSSHPIFENWKLYFRGKFWCPGFAPFSGRSQTRSASGAVNVATKDFVKKALKNNLLEEEDVKIWLKN
ncbi:Anti-lipopolysaccharide factor [Armadillidium nasatum]|uniref:Anti-lipopolysaccharide factor n=1 Tax=Armadillidium nasatum TaxID=96803 RepID=A0A5N5TLJ0_9CRUS|nr:Anti-lipopolysaccharide factor [Armadillidium nasatum]